MTMTIAEYSAGVDQLQRKLARIAELRAAIQSRQGRISAEQASAFAFNDARQHVTDATAVADVATPTFSEGTSNVEQAVGTAGMEEQRGAERSSIGIDDSVEGIFAAVKSQLAAGQGGDVPASSTATTITSPAQIENVQPNLNPSPDPSIGTQAKEVIDAALPALAESVTMGAITLSERDRKAIEKSPISGFVGSLIGDVPGIVGALGGAKLTAVGFKQLIPKLLESWNEGGEIVGRTIVNAAAREGLGGAYWSTIKQAVEEIKNPDEKRDWNERLTRLATDVGMFAIPGAIVEGAMAGRAASKVDDIVRPNEEVGRGPAVVPDEPVTNPVDTQPTVEYQAPREAPSKDQFRRIGDEVHQDLTDKLEKIDIVAESGPYKGESISGEQLAEQIGAIAEDAAVVYDAKGVNVGREFLEQRLALHTEDMSLTRENLQDLYLGVRSRIERSLGLAEQPRPDQLAALQDKFKPMDKVVEEGRQVTPPSGPRPDATPSIEVAEAWKPKQYDYAAREVNGKPVYGEVLDVSEDGATVTFKPRKGKPETVKASELREPESIPRTADDIDQVLEAAANKRRIAEEGSPLRKQAAEEFKPVEEVADDIGVVGGAEVGAPNVKGSFKRKVVDKATDLETQAKARIQKRLDDGGKLFDVVGASGEALANIGDLSIIGAAKIAKGAVKFADWSEEMIREFGDAIKPHLDKIYKSATDNYHRNRAQTTVDEHLAYMQDISQPFEFRPRTVKTEGGFRTGFQRYRDIKQGLREERTGQKLRGKALEESMIDDELRNFTEEAWKSGAPVMRTKQGTLIPVFDSKADAERIWDYVYGQAKAKLGKVPKTNAVDEHAITMEARKQFMQEMVNRGVALKVKRSGIQLSPDVKRKTDLSLYIILKADMGAEKLKSALAGIPAEDLAGRQAKLTELAMERGLVAPAVRAQGTYVPLEFATYRGFKDVQGEMLDPTRLVQTIDGALSADAKAAMPGQAGPAERMVLWRTRDMLKQKMAWQADMEAAAKRALGGLKDNELEQVSDIMEQLASKEADVLSVEGMLQHSEFRDITTDKKVLQAALDLRPIYDQVLDMQNALRAQRSQKMIPKRAFYSPHKQKEVAAWQELLGLNADPANLLSTGALIPDFVIPNKPSIGHDLQRQLLEPKYALEKNARVLLQKYLNAAARDIFDTSIIQNTKAFMDQLEVMGFGNSAVSLRNWVGQSFAGAPHAIDKGFTAAVSGAFGDVVGKNWQKWAGQFRGALARSVFPANFSWNLFLQTSSGVLTHTRYGTKNSITGALKWFGDAKFREEVADNAYSYIVKTQGSGRISHQDFNQGMSRAINLEKKPLEKAADAANYLSEWIERHMTGWSVATGYEDGLKKGLNGKALWEYASDAGAKTQSMYNKEDLPGLLRSNGVKTIAPFQTFGFEMWNTIQEVAGRIGTPPATKQERIKAVLRFVAGATAVNIAYSSASGRKPWETGSLIPFYSIFGAPVEAAVKGESMENASVRGLPSPVGIAVAFGKAVEDVITDGNWDKMISWVVRYGTAGVGIPAGTQLNRVYQGIAAISDGGVVDKNGKIIFPITGAKEQMQALFGGPWSTEAGQEKIAEREKGVIEFAPASSTAGKVGQAVAEALPVVGDVVQFKEPKEEPVIEIVPDVNPSRRRRSRPRSRR